ncbi:sigma-70 family RNA polymerase sigma factor [Neobacillus drentensis]|uniref:sigma-70 family RNA polymerase sigma factor n=1 Tax=Neobacillus drentensis TaxID=220684 RepID=UPI002FFD98B4
MPKNQIADLPYNFDQLNDVEKGRIIDELMNQHSRKVYLLAYSYVKDQGLAEDIAQEVFIKCYKSLRHFRGDAQITSWIYRITVNTAKDFLRSRSFNILKYPKIFFENITKSESPEDVVIQQDQREGVLQTVLGLSTKYREVIILYYFQDEKMEDIAEILNMNLNTVKTRLSRARSMLKGKITSFTGDELIEKRS